MTIAMTRSSHPRQNATRRFKNSCPHSLMANGFARPTPPPDEAKHVEQSISIVTHRRLNVNPKAYAAGRPDLCGHALLAGRYMRCPRASYKAVVESRVSRRVQRRKNMQFRLR
jgi:hypothetical protein